MIHLTFLKTPGVDVLDGGKLTYGDVVVGIAGVLFPYQAVIQPVRMLSIVQVYNDSCTK